MDAAWLGFGDEVLRALVFVPALLLALAAAPLVRCRVSALLVAVDLALLIEIVQALIDPGHWFGATMAARLLASVLQVGLATGLLRLWQRWAEATRTESYEAEAP